MSTTKGSGNIKLRKKLKLASGISRNDKRSVESLDSDGEGIRRSRNAQSRETKGDQVSNYGDNESSKKGSRVKRTVKSNASEEDVNGKSVISDGKRKRVYAHQDMEKEGTVEDNVGTFSRRSSLKAEQNKPKVDLYTQVKFSDSRIPRKHTLGRRFNNNELSNEKNPRMKANGIRQWKGAKVVGFGESSSMENVKRESRVKKPLDQIGSKKKAESLGRSSRSKVHDKKSLGDDTAVTDHRPKKKKRVTGIYPHDTSNKRMDDGQDNNKERQEYSAKEKTVELSKNAQFRAIHPSPSILSFVEDNLLGRRRDIQLRRAGYNIDVPAPLDNIPFSTSSERERIEEPVFRNRMEFFAAAKISSSFPPEDLPEVAFAGRSNVGKSSLLNSLTRQWGVVRTSDKPGLTQTINFFKLGSKLCLVDLPGYGFAYAKEEVKEAWEELVKEYVSTRVGLKRVCLLIDTKWGMRPRDHELIDLMERSQTKYQIILTKTDLVFPIDVARRAMEIEERLKANKSVVQPAMMISSKSGAGIRSLRTVLAKMARFVKP